MNIKERRLRNSSTTIIASQWRAPVVHKQKQDGFLLWFVPIILLFAVIIAVVLYVLNSNTHTANIMLNSQYDKMTLVAQGQTTLKDGKLYIGNSNQYTFPDQKFSFKNGNELISTSLTEGKYYKIYEIPSSLFKTWYAESYDPLAQ
jgi:hypothetical protein